MTRQSFRPFACCGLPLASLIALSACAGDSNLYPSLARRDVERAATSPSPSPTPLPSPSADPSVLAALPRAVAAAQAAQTRFAAARPGAERAVASGAGSTPGSEAWAVASIALAGLESARSDAMIALADVDALYAEAKVNGLGGQPEIMAAREAITAIVGEQDDVLASLRGRMGG